MPFQIDFVAGEDYTPIELFKHFLSRIRRRAVQPLFTGLKARNLSETRFLEDTPAAISHVGICFAPAAECGGTHRS